MPIPRRWDSPRMIGSTCARSTIRRSRCSARFSASHRPRYMTRLAGERRRRVSNSRWRASTITWIAFSRAGCASFRYRPSSVRRFAIALAGVSTKLVRSEEHTSELQSLAYLVCRLLLEKKKKKKIFSLELEYIHIEDRHVRDISTL